MEKYAQKKKKMDYHLTFALLLYFNIFYFGLFSTVEFFLLLFKVTFT